MARDNRFPLLDHPKKGKTVFLLSAFTFTYFLLAIPAAAYRTKFVLIGVLIELFTLPMLVLLALLCIASVIMLIRRRPSLSAWPWYSLFFLTATAILIAMA
jgi:hypothetical protein